MKISLFFTLLTPSVLATLATQQQQQQQQPLLSVSHTPIPSATPSNPPRPAQENTQAVFTRQEGGIGWRPDAKGCRSYGPCDVAAGMGMGCQGDGCVCGVPPVKGDVAEQTFCFYRGGGGGGGRG